MADYNLLIKTILDGSGIKKDIRKIQKIADKYPIELKTKIETAKTKSEIQEASKMLSELFSAKGFNIPERQISKVLDTFVKKADALDNTLAKSVERINKLKGFETANINKTQSAAFVSNHVEAETDTASISETLKNTSEELNTFVELSDQYMLVISKVLDTFDDINNLNSSLTEISKTTNLSADGLKKLGDDSFEKASKYGMSAGSYLDSVLEMSDAGFSAYESQSLAETSLLAQSAGDMTEELANSYIIAANAAYEYNGKAEKLNAMIDGQYLIADKNRIAMTDMAAAMNIAGTAAAECNVSVNDLSAMIGTIEAVTGLDGNQVGNGITSILNNLQDISSDKIVSTLDKANASMTEMAGGAEYLRNPISIIKDLAETFTELEDTDPLKSEILANIGGEYQSEELSALLNNMDLFNQMLIDYGNSSGSAMKSAQESTDSFDSSLNRLNNTWTNIVHNIADSSVFTGIVNVLNDVLSVINRVTSALGSIGTVGAITGGILGAKNLGKCMQVHMFQNNCFEYALYA
ncbi:MAG: phage tail tape measure protein [Lachnospiraceae bacterium]|nr:phage tail tape measure protein [Lachnospiraceae bacterium]